MKFIQPDYPALVKEARRQLSISQEGLARELVASYAVVTRWENGQAKPSILARAQLGASSEWMQAAGMLDLAENGHG